MKKTPYLFFLLSALFFAAPPQPAQAQIAVQIGPPPVCPYGYFDYPPYDCAPYGYYGPEWFPNGMFIGAGPWYHGRERFWGHVDNRYDRHHGYRGEYPRRGDRYDERYRHERMERRRWNEMRDGHNHSNLGREHEHHDRDDDDHRH
jgi:hypothetical protein